MFFDWFEFTSWLILALVGGVVVGIILTMPLYYDHQDDHKLRVSKWKFLWEHKFLVIFPAFLFICAVSYTYISTTTFRDAPIKGATQNVEN